MFEKGKLLPHDLTPGDSLDLLMSERVDSRDSHAGAEHGATEALRSIEWSDLTARLNAARDLRRELKNDSILLGGASGASFGDAAARFFRTLGEDQRSINHDDLEGSKASCDNDLAETAQACGGDERKQ